MVKTESLIDHERLTTQQPQEQQKALVRLAKHQFGICIMEKVVSERER